MATRLALLIVFAFADSATAAPPQAIRLSATVTALNGLFQKDASGKLGQNYVGRVVTVRGQVRDVTAGDGGQVLAIRGLPPTATDPAGCSVLFPTGHRSASVVGSLKPGMTVGVRGKIASVTGAAFTLADPVLVSASGEGVAKRAEMPPAPVKPKVEVKSADLKTTAVALTAKFRDDKTGAAEQAYAGQEFVVTGEVLAVKGTKLALLGCETAQLGDHEIISIDWVEGSPNLDRRRLRNLAEGDTVTIRGSLQVRPKAVGYFLELSPAKLLTGGENPPAVLTPTRSESAETFVRGALADRVGADKLRGQVVALTGLVYRADPDGSPQGFVMEAGELDAGTKQKAVVACNVVSDQIDAVWQLQPGQKVRVVGVMVGTKTDGVRLGKCRVVQLGPNPMPTVTAGELAAAFKADKASAGKKYGNFNDAKWFFLTGEVENKKPTEYGVTITFKALTGPKIIIVFSEDRAEKFKVGQDVRMKVWSWGQYPGNDFISLGGYLLPEAKTALPIAK